MRVPKSSIVSKRSQIISLLKRQEDRHPLVGRMTCPKTSAFGHGGVVSLGCDLVSVLGLGLVGAGDRFACFIPALAADKLRTMNPSTFARSVAVGVKTGAKRAFAFTGNRGFSHKHGGNTNGHTASESAAADLAFR